MYLFMKKLPLENRISTTAKSAKVQPIPSENRRPSRLPKRRKVAQRPTMTERV
jgi:hypothetical protein